MPEKTKTEVAASGEIPNYIWFLFAAIVFFVYFFGLAIPFVGPDEAMYGQVGREMLERGDWVTPTLAGFDWFEKPPLLYWFEIVFYRTFGVGEFAARLGPALCGIGTVCSLFFLGKFLDRSMAGANDIRRVAGGYGNWFALVGASTLGIVVFSHAASFDIIVTFSITAALISFFIFDQTDEYEAKYRPLVLFYVFAGVGLLAKGLIGILLPFAIVGVYYIILFRRPSRLFLTSLIWGTLLALAIAAFWYVPMYERHGYVFIDEFIVQQHFQRFVSNKFQHPQPFYFFLWVLPLMTLPWLPLFIASMWRQAVSMFNRGYAREHKEDGGIKPFHYSPISVFALAWIVVPVVFFSFSGSKLPGYILPAVPGAIILTAGFMFELGIKSHKWRISAVSVALSTLGVVILLLIFAVPQFAESGSIKSLIQAANDHGYASNRVLTLHTAPPNGEFYAAGRLLHDEKGKQRGLAGVGEVVAEINAENGATVLVLLPLECLLQLTADNKLNANVLKDNGKLAIVAVSLR